MSRVFDRGGSPGLSPTQEPANKPFFSTELLSFNCAPFEFIDLSPEFPPSEFLSRV